MQDKFEKNIKSHLENHEIKAPDNAWENISAALVNKKPKAKPWLKRLGIVAVILTPALLVTSIWMNDFDSSVSDSDKNLQNEESNVVNSQPDLNSINLHSKEVQPYDNDHNFENEIENKPSNENTLVNNFNSITDYKTDQNSNFKENIQGNNKIFRNQQLTNISKSNIDSRKIKVQKNYAVNPLLNFMDSSYDNIKSELNPPKLYEFYSPRQISKLEEDYLQTLEEKAASKERRVVNRNRNDIVFSPYAGIAFMGSLNESSWIAPEFNQLKIENQMATSYGSRAAYNINEKLKLRTGVGVMDLQQNSYDVPIVVNPEDGAISYNLRSYNNIGVDLSNYGQVANYNSTSELDGMNKMNEDISHELQFIEVPLEVEYSLSENQKLNFMATGGMSTMFVNKNEIYLANQASAFAKSTNMKSVSFSANAGMKMEYGFTDKISMNIEPQVRYMINTVTSNSGFQPYLLIMNAGFSVSF